MHSALRQQTSPLRLARSFAVVLVIAGLLAAPYAAAEPAPITIATPKPTESQDRNDGSGAAIALAAAGAAIAGLSCIEMLRQASKEPDPSQANLMRMMGMQQCSQAAQSLANAAQNQKGKDKISDKDDPAQQTTASNNDPTMAPTTAAEPTLAFTIPTAAATATPDELAPSVVVPAFFDQTPAPTAAPSTAPESLLASTTKTPAPSGGSTTLAPLDGPKIGIDETGNPDAPTATSGSGSVLSAVGANGAKSGDPASSKGADADKEKKRLAKNGDLSSGAGAGAAGGDAAKPAGDQSMDAMLAQLLGGPQPPLVLGGGDSGGKISVAGRGPASEVGGVEGGPNIFEFASYRYFSMSQDKRLHKKKAKPAKERRTVQAKSVGAKVKLASGGKP